MFHPLETTGALEFRVNVPDALVEQSIDGFRTAMQGYCLCESQPRTAITGHTQLTFHVCAVMRRDVNQVRTKIVNQFAQCPVTWLS